MNRRDFIYAASASAASAAVPTQALAQANAPANTQANTQANRDTGSSAHPADAKLRTVPGQQMKVSKSALMDVDLFAEYIDWRAEHPSDDLMTQLLNAEFEDEKGVTRKLSREEVLTFLILIASAGNDTTNRLIGWLGKVLGDNPDQRRLSYTRRRDHLV